MNGATSSPPPGRTIDIELGGQEVITVELDSLDPNPDDLLEVLKEGQCKVWIWTRLAAEYWRRGLLDAAEKIAKAAFQGALVLHILSNITPYPGEVLRDTDASGSGGISPILSFLATLSIAQAAQAPKLILNNASESHHTRSSILPHRY